MRTNLMRWAPYIALGLLAGAAARSHAATEPFAEHWRQELVRLQGWPAQVDREPGVIIFSGDRLQTCQMRWHRSTESALPPVLYLLDRLDAASFAPDADHTWVALEVPELLGKDAQASSPNPEQQGTHEAVLAAVRAFDILAGLKPRPSRRYGVVGEGLGGTLALAVAALRPDQVAFVAAHEPAEPAEPAGEMRRGLQRWARQAYEAQWYVAPEEFAQMVRAPALVSVGEAAQPACADSVEAVYEALAGPRELVTVRRGGHQPTDLRQWDVLWRQWAEGL